VVRGLVHVLCWVGIYLKNDCATSRGDFRKCNTFPLELRVNVGFTVYINENVFLSILVCCWFDVLRVHKIFFQGFQFTRVSWL